MTLTVVLAVVGVVGVACLLVRTLVQGKQLYGVERSREAGWDASLQSTLDLAEVHGWAVDETPTSREWPADLAAARSDGRTCLVAVRGPDFEASTWSAKERLPGASAGVQSRVWLLRLSAPEVLDDLFVRRAAPSEEALLLPERFEGRVDVHEPVGGLLAGGDFLAARDRLGPLVDQVAASGSWVITAPGEVTVMATLVPDADGFTWRLDLARRVAAALTD